MLCKIYKISSIRPLWDAEPSKRDIYEWSHMFDIPAEQFEHSPYSVDIQGSKHLVDTMDFQEPIYSIMRMSAPEVKRRAIRRALEPGVHPWWTQPDVVAFIYDRLILERV